VALEETLLYQFALMRDHAKGWVSLQEKSVRLTLGNPIRNISYLEGLRAFNAIPEVDSEKRKRDCPNTLSVVNENKRQKMNKEARRVNSLIDDFNVGTDMDEGADVAKKKKRKRKIITKAKAHNLFQSNMWTEEQIVLEMGRHLISLKLSTSEKEANFLDKRDEVLARNMLRHKETFNITKNHLAMGTTHKLLMTEGAVNNDKYRNRKRGAKLEDDGEDFSPNQLHKIQMQCSVFTAISKIMIIETEKETMLVKKFKDKLDRGENIKDALK
jgi:hypothetical protein